MREFVSKLMIIISCILAISFTISCTREKVNGANENKIEIKYEYNNTKNQVVAKIVSNVKLKDTKPTWKLSNDKLTYTKIFTENQTYETDVEDISGKKTRVKIEIKQIQDLKIDFKYEYNASNSQVTVKMISNVELKNTKPTWKLSNDKLTYTKSFTQNQTYETGVEDINGKKTTVKIDITKIQKLKIDVKYEYNSTNTQVTVKMVSDRELKNTKPTWTLSKDKLTYTKSFTQNQNYSTGVEDIYGNKINVNIKIDKIKDAKITTKPIYDKNTNKVTMQIISDVKLKNTKPTWKLSTDGCIYTKVFDSNTKYSTGVEDIYGRKYTVEINVTQVDKTPPQIKLEYKYNDNNTVTIYMKSNEELGNTKPTWILSKDKLIYEKTFSDNQDYSTGVQDIHGNNTTVTIKLKKKKSDYNQKDGSKISVRYMYTSYNNVIVQIVSSVKMEDTKPTWKLSEDKYCYTKTFYEDTKYTTGIQDINGVKKDVEINVDMFFKFTYEKGSYGISGAWIHGVPGGSELEYYKIGSGENVLFTTFCVHGYEDSWSRDGSFLVDIANNFYNRLVNDKDVNLAKKWTIYIFKEVNPDGRKLGHTNNGPGRTTLYSKLGKGMDINRCWQTGSSYKRFTDNRNYNGTQGFQAYEAESLRNFLLSHKSKNGQTVLVDLHGWENQLIGDEQVCKYYKQQYTSCATSGYGRYGTQYLITWARQNLGAKVALVELPLASNVQQANNMGLSNKYINATLNMLKGI